MRRPELAALSSIAQQAEVTGIGWRSLSRFYALPSDLRRLRILDLCAGMSDFTFRLRERGAEAYALEVYYGDLVALRSRHRRGFADIARNVFHTRPDSDKAKEIYRSYVEGFEDGLRMHPSMYVGGSATDIPFSSETFDLVTSFNGLFGTLDYDFGVLSAGLRETIRIVKPGGAIQLIPYQSGPVLNDHERGNQRSAIRALAAAGGIELDEAVAREDPALGGRVGRLTIRKTNPRRAV